MITMKAEEGRQLCEEKIFPRNFTRFGLDVNPIVSFASGFFVVVFSLFALLNLDLASRLFEAMNEAIVTNFDWVFILSSNFFIIVCLFLALSRLGTVRIGGVHAQVEFTNFAWYSMLLSAGMGIGLMFWAVGEPLHHFANTPPIFGSPEAAHTSLATTFFHWGLHPWGIYALMSLGLAFFAFNKQLPLSLRSVFYPLLKDKICGPLGDLIDTFAVLSVLFGLATSLGLGIQQINSGLDYMTGVGFSVSIQIILIALITLIAIISVLAGIDKGIKFLATLNMKIALVFMVIIFLLGPTGYILRLFSNSLGLYIGNIVADSFYIAVGDGSWQGSWSIFYLAWWISWSPFVGMFIARISKGRTVRELILGVLIVPSLLSFFWLSVFGGTAISIDQAMGGSLFEVVRDDLPVALFEMISFLSVPVLADLARMAMFILATVLVIVYFITSSDSGSLVVDKMTSGGKINTPAKQRVFWCSLEGLIAAVLLIIGGEQALEALQTAVISAGLPLSIILVVMTISLVKGLEAAHTKQMWVLDAKRFERFIHARSEEEETEGE